MLLRRITSYCNQQIRHQKVWFFFLGDHKWNIGILSHASWIPGQDDQQMIFSFWFNFRLSRIDETIFISKYTYFCIWNRLDCWKPILCLDSLTSIFQCPFIKLWWPSSTHITIILSAKLGSELWTSHAIQYEYACKCIISSRVIYESERERQRSCVGLYTHTHTDTHT